MAGKKEEDYIIVFDLDETLVNTDHANSIAYQQAVYEITGMPINAGGCRLTRKNVQDRLNASDSVMHKIIVRKEELFPAYLKYTAPMPALFILKHLKNTCCILLTLARRERARIVLDYYGVSQLFDRLYFWEDYAGTPKFEYLICKKYYAPEKIILFENEQDQIDEAVYNGIPIQNIYKS